LAGVALVHVALGYAFVNGLAFNVIKDKLTVLRIYDVDEKKPPKEIPKIAPVKRETKITTPDKVVVKAPAGTDKIDIYVPTTSKQPPANDGAISTPPPELARTLQVKGDRPSWVTTVDYPTQSIRNGEEGRVAFTVQVGTNGRVTSCRVTGSSGYPALDEAACHFYAKRARFLPALAADGTPVAASRADSVRWQLPAD
jgi:protein TonB